MIDFKPSNVEINPGAPLVDTMGKCEAEVAAAFIVRTCHHLGDVWQAVTWSQIRDVMLADRDAKREPFASMLGNPFLRPDVYRLIAKGYARWTETDDGSGPVELTDEGKIRLSRWVDHPAARIAFSLTEAFRAIRAIQWAR